MKSIDTDNGFIDGKPGSIEGARDCRVMSDRDSGGGGTGPYTLMSDCLLVVPGMVGW